MAGVALVWIVRVWGCDTTHAGLRDTILESEVLMARLVDAGVTFEAQRNGTAVIPDRVDVAQDRLAQVVRIIASNC